MGFLNFVSNLFLRGKCLEINVLCLVLFFKCKVNLLDKMVDIVRLVLYVW